MARDRQNEFGCVEDFVVANERRMAARISRSTVTGISAVNNQAQATLYYVKNGNRMTFRVNNVSRGTWADFSCRPRKQFGGTVLVFGNDLIYGGFHAVGHGVLNGNVLSIRLANGDNFRMDVDPTALHLKPFAMKQQPVIGKVYESRKAESSNDLSFRTNQVQPHAYASTNRQNSQSIDFEIPENEKDDISEEDIRRLRGELPIRQVAFR